MSAAQINAILAKARGLEGRRRSLQPAAEPNVIPFIDVLLVLLIIFMVTAPKPTVDLQVELPGPNPVYTPPQGIEPTFIALRDTPAGIEVMVDNVVVPLEALAATAFAHARANNPALDVERIYADAHLYVRADQDTAYGNVVGVMDALKGEGFAQVSVFAERAEEG